ncbi:conserved hypothetical protein [Hyphomicrobiales bacterium]|nr:conserved hypothetical protein [Hyphomicrobiales bacterium]CAH1673462.1 conserved hypothetical protein [Hyphomicrobiales bacterium]
MEAPAEPWFSPLSEFYREVERLFSKEWGHYAENVATSCGWPTGNAPEFWKGAGDELLYTKELSDHREVLACICCWAKAINEYRGRLRERFPSLDLKSTAWVAGFPVHNAEVIFRAAVEKLDEQEDEDDPIYENLQLLEKFYSRRNSRGLARDFIGPSIDTGFRLSTLATPRRFVISVELALLLVAAERNRHQIMKTKYDAIKFHYAGRVPLKGVIGGLSYPVFWIDMHLHDKLSLSEDDLMGVQARNTDQVSRFCEEFINSNPDYFFHPYIVGDLQFNNIPESHQERLGKLNSFWESERKRRRGEALPLSDADAKLQDSDQGSAPIAPEKLFGRPNE